MPRCCVTAPSRTLPTTGSPVAATGSSPPEGWSGSSLLRLAVPRPAGTPFDAGVGRCWRRRRLGTPRPPSTWAGSGSGLRPRRRGPSAGSDGASPGCGPWRPMAPSRPLLAPTWIRQGCIRRRTAPGSGSCGRAASGRRTSRDTAQARDLEERATTRGRLRGGDCPRLQRLLAPARARPRCSARSSPRMLTGAARPDQVAGVTWQGSGPRSGCPWPASLTRPGHRDRRSRRRRRSGATMGHRRFDVRPRACIIPPRTVLVSGAASLARTVLVSLLRPGRAGCPAAVLVVCVGGVPAARR